MNGIVPALIAEAHGLAVPEQVVPELLLVPSEAGQGQPGGQQHLRCPLHAPIVQLLGDSRQSQKVIILRSGLIPLEGLAGAAHHIILSAVLQDVFLGVRLMLVLHQPGGEGNMGGFHGRIAVIHPNDDQVTHLASPSFFRDSFFFKSYCFPCSSIDRTCSNPMFQPILSVSNRSAPPYLAHSRG